MRAYVFIERIRGVDFWALDDVISTLRRDQTVPLRTHFSIFGKYDVVVIIEGINESDISDSITAIYERSRDPQIPSRNLIRDTTTMIAIKPATVISWPELATVVAIDVAIGHDEYVRAQLLEASRNIKVADAVLGEHDIIALVDADVERQEYCSILSKIASIEGVDKTRTMFSLVRPYEDRYNRRRAH